MTIKQHGGVFGRNPTFNTVTAESLTVSGNALPDASTLLVDGDIGSTVQAYDADTAKLDAAQEFTAAQTFNEGIVIAATKAVDFGDVTLTASGSNIVVSDEIQSGAMSSFSTTSGGSATVDFTISDNSVYGFEINFFNNDGGYMAAGNVHMINGLMGFHTDYYKKLAGANAPGTISFSISGSTLTFSYTAPAGVTTTSSNTRIHLARKFVK